MSKMGNSAASFQLRTALPQRIVDSALHHSDPPGPSGVGLLFLTGELAHKGGEIAEGLDKARTGQTWLVAAARGVLTERGEVNQEPAAAGLWIPGARPAVVAGRSSESRLGTELAHLLHLHPAASALVFSSSPPERDGWLLELNTSSPGRVLGAGTLPGAAVHWVQDGIVSSQALALVLRGIPSPHIVSSSACRLLSPLCVATKTRGSMLLELDGVPALTVLSESAASLDEQPLILLAVGSGDQPLSVEGRALSLHPIQGVDPAQSGILLGEPLPPGARVAFAVRDAHAARTDLKAHLGALGRGTAGAAPRFGLYFDGAGRGRQLYGATDVDVRLIKEQFPGMALLGFHSTFELAVRDGRLSPQICSGMLGLFCAPS